MTEMYMKPCHWHRLYFKGYICQVHPAENSSTRGWDRSDPTRRPAEGRRTGRETALALSARPSCRTDDESRVGPHYARQEIVPLGNFLHLNNVIELHE